MRHHYHYQCDEYCEDCLPIDPNSDDPELDLDQGSQDSMATCCKCHHILDCSLTAVGIENIFEAMRESLRDGRETRNKIHAVYTGTYYDGSRQVEIVRDWATWLRWNYHLERKQRTFIDKFLSWTDK